LKFELEKVNSALQLARGACEKAKESESSMKEKLSKCMEDLDKYRLESRKLSAQLNETKTDLEAQIKSLEKLTEVRFL
jgi:hypothetical protein